ncbi:MAG TPA: TetR/AcrR family transcriptional regulator [Thermoleophilaceae bacterium]|nr:TetR/AcrR family transcriptional regulator [Thermoleophilaceae bacterium]
MRTTLSRADRQARTREELVGAADRLFTTNGFHATSIDAVADAAGYTKGAVYSNFASKEDLFLAVYSRRVDRRVEEMNATLASAPTFFEGMEKLVSGLEQRTDDGWLAVFFEFWAHVLRHPELRDRFAEHHRRGMEPVAATMERVAEERGEQLREDPTKLATARLAMATGLQLERLTQPDLVDAGLTLRMMRLAMDEGGLDGLPGEAPSGLPARSARKQGARRA